MSYRLHRFLTRSVIIAVPCCYTHASASRSMAPGVSGWTSKKYVLCSRNCLRVPPTHPVRLHQRLHNISRAMINTRHTGAKIRRKRIVLDQALANMTTEVPTKPKSCPAFVPSNRHDIWHRARLTKCATQPVINTTHTAQMSTLLSNMGLLCAKIMSAATATTSRKRAITRVTLNTLLLGNMPSQRRS